MERIGVETEEKKEEEEEEEEVRKERGEGEEGKGKGGKKKKKRTPLFNHLTRDMARNQNLQTPLSPRPFERGEIRRKGRKCPPSLYTEQYVPLGDENRMMLEPQPPPSLV